MANIKSFPNNQDEYIGAQDVMRWLHGRTSGVFGAAGNAAVAPVLGEMAVTVSDGNGWLSNDNGDGVVWWIDNESVNGSKLELTVSMADAVLPRIDRVVVSWQTTNYVALPEVQILKGVPASNPTAPELTNNNILRQISLAAIYIPAGATAIDSLNITDERLNPAVCGIVTESVKADTSIMNAQYNEAVRQLKNAIAQAWNGEISDGSITAEKLAPDFAVSAEFRYWLLSGSWMTPAEAANEWTGVDFDYIGENVYAQAFRLEGVKANDNPIVDVDLGAAGDALDMAIKYRDAWACIDRVTVPHDNIVVAYCFDTAPDIAVPVIMKVVH